MFLNNNVAKNVSENRIVLPCYLWWKQKCKTFCFSNKKKCVVKIVYHFRIQFIENRKIIIELNFTYCLKKWICLSKTIKSVENRNNFLLSNLYFLLCKIMWTLLWIVRRMYYKSWNVQGQFVKVSQICGKGISKTLAKYYNWLSFKKKREENVVWTFCANFALSFRKCFRRFVLCLF